ncbi:hypothetical protein GI584_14255 [Gracilibacillus salitolerans]|uniref:Phage protein, HK97 gp10 family n=1 Tax=Gracilibacillus salitolerans TaxID=2663022 RepID=A0A5Q2TKC7_9BACI|nr:hypothetical protein [Gracilibacillus salitolerans]QGH35135.1 hypothetical protein GI584_14255 [Gracilibacillus salitolerans]
MDLRFEGLDELLRETELIELAPSRVKNRALRKAGDLLRDRMKEEVYNHGLEPYSGEAQESIVRTEPKKGEVMVGTEGGVQQPGYYLYMHEFGYYNVMAKRFIPPKPFASISYELSKGQILDIYVEELRKELKL